MSISPAITGRFCQPEHGPFTSRDMTDSHVVKLPFAVVTADSQVSKLLVDGQCFPRPRAPGFWQLAWHLEVRRATLKK
jgi:hypothetical protein